MSGIITLIGVGLFIYGNLPWGAGLMLLGITLTCLEEYRWRD